ncbi:MAG: proteinral secretion pathway protein A [Halanaerobium sp.]|jgi:type II secretory pathway predicted ATPase ExeA|nr:MAG: general secretion pathway protein A [Halanaerobium sp. T82-1]PUU87932.1 MAG: proteinral secretion pathway protein A [Halanaerobium sp.]
MTNINTAIAENFRLKKIPFLERNKVAFKSGVFEENIMFLSTVFNSRQIAVVTGPSGSGKSSLIFYAVNELDPAEYRVVHLELSKPGKKTLYKTLAVKMGLKPAFLADDIRLQIIDFFHEENAQGKFNCVVIDEAHSLSIELIDELRSFYDEGANFSLVLAGLPQLLNRSLNLSMTIPMKQRISLFLECSGLSLSETKDYISYQLDDAASQNDIIDEKCFPLLHSMTSGIPRKINQACYGALLECFKTKKSIITEDVFKKVNDKLSYT